MDLPKATAEASVRRSCRLLDGREAVTFLVRIKQYIEDPRFML
jgi:pyruvate/2-oxoglutarate dehydrogenase complex dihydrolipoamide acyltransferase (E2) component